MSDPLILSHAHTHTHPFPFSLSLPFSQPEPIPTCAACAPVGKKNLERRTLPDAAATAARRPMEGSAASNGLVHSPPVQNSMPPQGSTSVVPQDEAYLVHGEVYDHDFAAGVNMAGADAGGGRPLSKEDQHPLEQASPYIFSHMAPAPAALGVDIERLEGAADMVSDVAGQVSLSYLLSEHVSFYVSSCVSLYTCFYGP